MQFIALLIKMSLHYANVCAKVYLEQMFLNNVVSGGELFWNI